MSNFSSDSDLLVYEPMVFHELPFAGQTKLKVTDASIAGQTVTSAAGGFTRLGAGDVAVIGDGAFAIASVVNDTTLTLAVVPVGVSGPTMTVRSFGAQAGLVHEELLRAVGIDPDDPDSPAEAAVVSVGLMKQLEALGTLARAYTGGISTGGDSRRVAEKAEQYRARFARGLLSAAVLMDLDGDGRAEVIRHPGVARMYRQ